jgi:hypothetical protein
MEINHGSSCYRVEKKVADGDTYRTYLCTEKSTGRCCLFLITTSVQQNGQLDRWAYALRELKRKSDEIEAEYAQVKADDSRPLNYDLQFPEVLDCFVSAEQGGRRILIVAFRNVEKVTDLVPLSNLTSKNRLRVDLRTSVWIAGKLLKLLTFAHSEGIATGLMSSRNILIAPNIHYVVMFDWSQATVAEPNELTIESKREDIMGVSRSVLTALGSDLTQGAIPDTNDTELPYAEFLFWLARGNENNAEKAHRRLYEISDSIWQRQFYPFTTKPLLMQN